MFAQTEEKLQMTVKTVSIRNTQEEKDEVWSLLGTVGHSRRTETLTDLAH